MPPPCHNVPLTFCGRDFNPFYFPHSTLPIFALPVDFCSSVLLLISPSSNYWITNFVILCFHFLLLSIVSIY